MNLCREGHHAYHNTPPKRLSTGALSLDKISRVFSRMHLAVSIQKKSSHQHASHGDYPRVATTLAQPADPRLHACVITNNPPLRPESNSPNTRRVRKVTGHRFRLQQIRFTFHQLPRYHPLLAARSIWPQVKLSFLSEPCSLLKTSL